MENTLKPIADVIRAADIAYTASNQMIKINVEDTPFELRIWEPSTIVLAINAPFGPAYFVASTTKHALFEGGETRHVNATPETISRCTDLGANESASDPAQWRDLIRTLQDAWSKNQS